MKGKNYATETKGNQSGAAREEIGPTKGCTKVYKDVGKSSYVHPCTYSFVAQPFFSRRAPTDCPWVWQRMKIHQFTSHTSVLCSVLRVISFLPRIFGTVAFKLSLRSGFFLDINKKNHSVI